MGRPPKRSPHARRKAKTKGTELAQAKHIWEKDLELHKYKFREQPRMTEKQISMETWEGCDSLTYDMNPGFYKRWNDRVIEYWRSIDDRCRIIRINDVMPKRAGKPAERVTRICKSDRAHAIRKLEHKTKITAGVMASAISDNERYGLKQNVGKMIAVQAYEKVKNLPGISEERKMELIAETAFSNAVETGQQLGQKNLAQNVLDILDQKPALIAVDEKNDDNYSNRAKKNREEMEAKQ